MPKNVILFDFTSDLYAVMISWYMNKVTEWQRKALHRRIWTQKNLWKAWKTKIPSVKHFPFTRFLWSGFTITRVFEQSTEFLWQNSTITHKHFHDGKKDNGDKYEPHTKTKQNRADLFPADEIQMIYSKGKLGAAKLSICTLIFWIEKTVHRRI